MTTAEKQPAASPVSISHNRDGAILFTVRLGNGFRHLIVYLVTWLYECFYSGALKHREVPLSPETTAQLKAVDRKTLVLDLDETLVHACRIDRDPKYCCCQAPEKVVPDFVILVTAKGTSVPVRVFKRPHIDRFLHLVSKWYDLVIYTASTSVYADAVLDHLDGGRGRLNRRFYREHCRADRLMGKNLWLMGTALSGTFIIDNQPKSYADFPDNALPIKNFFYDPKDIELLTLLPFLDCLRFTRDVRSVLGRRLER